MPKPESEINPIKIDKSDQFIHVLCIDDDIDFASLIRIFLENLSEGLLKLEIILSAKSALSLIENGKFDVIVSDYQMPDMNGLELLEELRKQGNEIPFILITGHSREEIAIQALNLGADYYLQKGKNIETLAHKLKHFIYKSTELKRTEKALYESGEVFRLAFYNANIGMCLVDLEGRLTKTNSMMSEIFGYTREELENMTVNDIAYHEDLNLSPQFIKQSLSGDSSKTQFEKRYIHKLGHIVRCQLISSLIRDKQGLPLYYISHIIDITKQKQAEENLRKSEERFRNFMDSAPEAITLLDSNLNYVDFNKNALAYWPDGTEKEDLIGQNLRDSIPNFQKKELYVKYQEVIRSGSPFFVDEVFSHPQYGKYYLNIHAFKVGNGLGIIETNITKLMKTQMDLRKSEEQFRKIFEDGSIGIVLTDLQNNRFIKANAAFCKMIGYTEQELTNLTVADITHPEIIESNILSHKKLEQGEILAYKTEKRYITKNQEIIWCRVLVSNIHDIDGTPLQNLAMIEDITDRKHIEKALIENEERYRTIFNLSPDGILLFDPETLKIVEFNRTAHLQLDYSRKEFSNLTIFDIESKETPEETIEHTKKLLEGEKIILDFETIHHTKLGENRYVSVKAQPLEINNRVMVYSIVRDITDRTIIEENLLKKTHDLGERVKELNCLFKITEIMTDSYKSTKEIIFEIVEHIIPPAWQYPEITCARITIGGNIFKSKKFHETPWKQIADITIESKNLGSIDVFYLESKPVIHEGPFLKEERDLINEIATKIGYYYMRRLADEQLKLQKQELSEFANQIAHDSHNSLVMIQSYADLLIKDNSHSYANKIKSISKDILKLHQSSVELADAGLIIERKEHVNLYVTLTNVSSNVIPNNINFSISKLPTVFCDPQKVSQAFRNLFENAVTHGQPTKIEVIFNHPNLILVRNDGKKIPEHMRKNVFQKGVSTKEKGGLGLSIVKKIIEAHGWKIRLNSDEETTFCIEISI